MRSILVLNSKGGSGKTTLATNIAAYYAVKGHSVALLDFDPQGCSIDWLAARPEHRAPIKGITAWEGGARVSRSLDYAIIDAPAALRGRALAELVRRAQSVVVPVVPSAIDMRAAVHFHDELMEIGRVINKQVKLATVANRVREISPSRFVLEDFLRSLKLPDGRRLPFITCLRNTQNYVHAAERGLGICEMAPSMVNHDLELWRPLLRWLNSSRSVPEE
jgi:chromosome partitioning protein